MGVGFVVWNMDIVVCGVVTPSGAIHGAVLLNTLGLMAPARPVPVVKWRAPGREDTLVALWTGPRTRSDGLDIAG